MMLRKSCRPEGRGTFEAARGFASGRAGFTLLELLLATVLAVMLLAALYMAMSVTVRQTQVSRDATELEHLSRGIFNKIGADLSGTLGPLPPKSGGNSAASGGTTAPAATTPTTDPAASTTPATGTAATPTTTAPTDGTAATTDPGATDNATAVAANYSFQGGIVAVPDEKKLVIYAGRVPEAFGRFGNRGEQTRSDQRQIIYQLIDDRGLFRQERPWVTADGVRDSLELDPDSPDTVLIAEEVIGLDFEYSDGSAWLVDWDGTLPGPDGVTPLGPPRAIRVTLTLKIPVGKNQFSEKRMSQVIPVRSAPGTYTSPLVEAPIDGATETTPADPAASGTTPSTVGTTPTTGGAASATGGTTPTTGGAAMPSTGSGMSGAKTGGGR